MIDEAENTEEQLQVAFPASPTFTRIGRVAVVGLALRLGIDVSTVEQLRSAVDAAVSALQGDGRIRAAASWTANSLSVIISNPDVAIGDREALTSELWALIGETVVVDRDQVTLTLPTTER
ncbi:MAG: hypothetical protein AAF531_23225 [Actinomycetota bacterium]